MNTILVVIKTSYDFGDNSTIILKCFTNNKEGNEKAQNFVAKQKENDLYEFEMHKKLEDFTTKFKNNHEISKFGSLSGLYDLKNPEQAKERKEKFSQLCKKYTNEWTIVMKEFKKSLGVDENKIFSGQSVEYYNYDIEEVEMD